MTKQVASLIVVAAGFIALTPEVSLACPICFGADPDSSIAQGVNWAVFTMLGVTGGVLSGFVGFIFHLMKKSRQAMGRDHDFGDLANSSKGEF
jgi:hypothetical protein